MRGKKNPIASPPTATSRCHIAATETILLPNGRGEEKLLTRWIRHHWKSTALSEDQFSSQGFAFIMLSGCTREQIFVCLLTQRLCPGSAQAELTALITAQPPLGQHGGGSASQTGLPALRETTCTFVLKVFTLHYLQRAFLNLIKESAFRRGLFSTGLVKIHSYFAKS